jgi:hypothetical protein
LTVFGAPEKVAEFMKKARGPHQHFKQSEFDKREEEWRRKHCQEQGIPFESDEEREKKEYAFSFHALVPIPASIMALDYDPHGYAAERQLWGIKWGGSTETVKHYDQGSVTYEYQTPWAPGVKFFETMTQKFPDLMFAVSFSEEFPTRGRFLFQNGKSDHSQEIAHNPQFPDSTPADYKELPEYSEDMSSEEEEKVHAAHKAWQSKYYDEHDAWVKTLRAALAISLPPT